MLNLMRKALGTDEASLAEKQGRILSKYREQAKELITNESLTCNRCNTLAVPMLGEGNVDRKYKCLKCNNQFLSVEHEIWSKLTRMFYFYGSKDYPLDPSRSLEEGTPSRVVKTTDALYRQTIMQLKKELS